MGAWRACAWRLAVLALGAVLSNLPGASAVVELKACLPEGQRNSIAQNFARGALGLQWDTWPTSQVPV